MKAKQKEKWIKCVVLACIIIVLLVLALLQSKTTYTTDDYYYSSFLNGSSISSFIKKNIEHYQTRNGRVIVHILAELLLGAGMQIFAVVNTVFIFGIWFLFEKAQDAVSKPSPLGFILFLLDYVFANYKSLSASILCVADACNYIFPVLLVGSTIVLLEKSTSDSRFRLLSFLCAFLSGASTELGGIACISIIILNCIVFAFNREFRSRKHYIIAFVCTAIGLATIFMSPATRDRVATEFSVLRIVYIFEQYAVHFVLPGRHLCVMILISLSIVINAGRNKEFLALQCFGIVMTIILAICAFFTPDSRRYAAVFFLFCVFTSCAGAVYIFTNRHRTTGCILLTSMALVAVMLLTNTPAARVTVPPALLLASVASHLIVDSLRTTSLLTKNIASLFASIVATIAIVVNLCPIYQGISSNYRIMQSNAVAAREAKQTYTLTYEDYDDRYSLCAMFSSSIFEHMYLEHYGILGAKVDYHINPDVNAVIPTVIKNNEKYVALRSFLDLRNGTLFWSEGYMEISIGGQRFVYSEPFLYYRSDSGKTKTDVADEILLYENVTYISPNLQHILSNI